MTSPKMSSLFASKQPSAIRKAQVEFYRRADVDDMEVVNLAIGNVSLPMHPAMQSRLFNLNSPESPFADGVLRYSATQGEEETRAAVLNIIASAELNVDGLSCQITDGASQAMELVILGVCGDAGSDKKPLLLIEPAYTNYMNLAERVGRKTIAVQRVLNEAGQFDMPDMAAIEKSIEVHQPGALVVIPADNPTGQNMAHETLMALGKLVVKHNLWIISDEAYRELQYDGGQSSTSVWRLTEEEVPGITGRRISLETASKVWNACGLRIGALVSDNPEFLEKSVSENMSNLCANVVGQYVFGALANQSHEALGAWYKTQRKHYSVLIKTFVEAVKQACPGIIVSRPDAAIYSVLDVRNIVKPGFDAGDFVSFCASQGKVQLDGKNYTLLTSLMTGFYTNDEQVGGADNPGKTQMRLAYVESEEKMALAPTIFAKLLEAFEAHR